MTLPLAADLRGARVVVLGAGRVGATKIDLLLEAGARVRVIAERVLVPLASDVEVLERRYQAGDLAGARLVVSATGDPAVNDHVVTEATDRGVWLNVVDDPARSTFYFMALHREGEVCLAVTTDGASPALAQELRDRAARTLPAHVARVAATLREERRRLHARAQSTEGRNWRALVRTLLDGPASDVGPGTEA